MNNLEKINLLHYCNSIKLLVNADFNLIDLSTSDDDSSFSFKCKNCPYDKETCLRYHRCGMRHALKNMGNHTYSCPNNKQFLAMDFYSKSKPFACILLGPFTITAENSAKVKGEITASRLMAAQEYISDFAKLYNTSTYSTTFFDISMEEAPSATLTPVFDAYVGFDMEQERAIERFVMSRRSQEASEAAQQFLERLLSMLDRDFHELRFRAQELVTVVSRAAMSDSGNFPVCFSKNNFYYKAIQSSHTLEEITDHVCECIRFYCDLTIDFSNSKHPEIIIRATDYIKQHYHEKITLLDVADYCEISTSYLSKILKEELNSSFTEYTNFVRIEKSKTLLTEKRMRIADVAAACGFEDQSYFTKVFKKSVGVNPCKYRDSARAEHV